MRTMLRGKVTLLIMMLGLLLAIPAVALADVINGDADADALAAPHGNTKTDTLAPGSAVATYNFDAFVQNTGPTSGTQANANDVFKVAGDYVKVDIARTGDWLNTSDSGSPASFTFTQYTVNDTSASTPDNSQAGTIKIKVPCGATGSKDMTVKLTPTAKNAGPNGIIGDSDDTTLPAERQLASTLTFTYTIMAGATPDASCTPANHAPTVSTAAQDASGDEGSELTTSGAFSDEDDDALTIEQQSGAGTVTPSDNGAWSWSHTPNDNSSNNTVVVRATDPDGEFVEDTFTWSAANVAPTATKSFDSSVAEGSSINLALTSPSDPSSADTTAGFTYAFRCAGGYSAFGPSSSATCSTNDDGALAVGAKIKDKDDGVTEYTDTVIVNNVPPTITNITASAQNVLAGKDVTFTGTATDPSSVDTTAGFFWQWAVDGGALGTFGTQGNSQFKHSFSDCGSHSVSAKAKDKDDGLSDLFTKSNVVNVYSAHYLAPLNEGMYNTVQAGRVVPVKISVGCSGNLTGLQPSIQMLKGEQDGGENTTGSDNVETLSVSSADQSGVMRTIDGGYIYNLQVPSTAKANDLYTIRVNPFGGSNASSNMYIVLKIRK